GFTVEEGWEIVGIARNAGTNQSVFGLDNTFMQGGVQSPYNSFYLVAKKKVSSVTLSKETLTLEFGAQETLTAELINVKETTWTSSDDSVVTVAEDGTITAVGLGTAVITCADKTDENIKATCEVTVEDSTVLAAAVSVISETGVKVTWNEVPSAESYQIYRLEVGNGSYVVAATAEAGETEWTDTSLSAGKKYRYYVEVYATVNGEKKAIKKSAIRTCITPKITLSRTAMNLQYGKTATLKATKVGVTAVTWTSSDPKIAKVSANGTITATGLGTVTITCASKTKEEVMATCEVTVRDTTLLQMKATAGKTNNLLSWNKIPSADGYRIYGGECGSTMKLIKTVSAGTQSWNHSGLKAGKAYRYCVKAYRIVNGAETVTKTSNTVHSITASSKFTNAKSVTVSETSVALQVGESKNLGAKAVAADASRTLLPHTAELVYKSSSSKVATVSKDGTVTAVGKGTCRIYVTAGSGASATVTVTVK
ncbi:MAG: Ig-like domain-containing protein, partial [Lachnospiraceae bacterium]